MAKMNADMSAAATNLILDGFMASSFTKKRIRKFVSDYKAGQDPQPLS